MSTVKLGLSTLTATEMVAKGQGIHDAMSGNINFATPTPTLVVVQAAIDALAAANAAVDNNGGKQEHQARREAKKDLHGILKQLGGYVQNITAGDEDKILSSAFEVVKHGAPLGELVPPSNFHNRFTVKTGRIALYWDRERGADMHHVFMSSSNDPLKWELIGTTTKSRFNVENLTPGTFYWFSVTAIGAAGETSKSDVVRAMAAA